MPKKKTQETPKETKAPPAETVEEAKPQYYSAENWKGIKEVFRCERCGTFLDDKDSIIMHVLTHYPKHEQEALLDQLLKEK